MATASLNIRLNYRQILELARQLSDEDKLLLNRELAAEARRIELQSLLETFKNDEISYDKMVVKFLKQHEISYEEITAEVEQIRQARYEEKR